MVIVIILPLIDQLFMDHISRQIMFLGFMDNPSKKMEHL